MNIKKILIWLITITLAFFAGYFSNGTRHTVKENTLKQVQAQTLANETVRTKSKIVSVSKKDESVEDKPSSKEDSQMAIKEVKLLLGKSTFMMDLSSIVKSYDIIQKFSEEDVNNALVELEGSISANKNIMVVSLLIGRYSELNSYGAIDFIENNMKSSRNKSLSLNTAINSWAKSDPNSAYDWAKESDRDSEQSGLISSFKYAAIFNGLAKQNIDDAFIKLGELSNNDGSAKMAAIGIAETLEQSDEFTSFYENSKNLGNDSLMTNAISSWVNKDPQVVTEWLNSVEAGEDKTAMQSNVLDNWINSEPSAAADWYMNESNSDNRQASVNKIARRWGMTEPKQALEWINQQPDIDNEITTNSLLQSSIYTNTQFSMNNLHLLKDEDNKRRISRQIYSTLKQKSKKDAESFLNESDYKEYILADKRKKK